MGITTEALNILSANMTGSSLLTHIAVGTSGTAFVSGDTSLATETNRNTITSSDLGTAEEITFIGDFSPVDVSGLIIKEHGGFTTASGLLMRVALTGSLVMTGEEELQIQETFKFFI